MGASKTRDNIHIKIKMPNLSQELPSSSKAQNQDLKDMEICWIFQIKIESQNSDLGCIKIKMLNLSQETTKVLQSFK